MVEDPRTWSPVDLGGLSAVNIATVTASFEGTAVRVADILRRSRPLPAADHCTVESDDGLYRASVPLGDVMARGWLIYGLGGRPLARERGGPLRLVVDDGRTLCWNVKGVAELRVTQGPEPDSVPESPPH